MNLLPRTLCLGLGLALTPALFAQSAPMTPAAVKTLFDSWRAPVPGRRLVGNIHYVGAIGVSSFLITTPEGHILLDTGFEDTVPIIQKSVEQLGFKLSDIKIILSSHAHIDHVGGHAAMQRLTGAPIFASVEDAKTIESGGKDDFIPLPQETILYTPVKVAHRLQDEEKVTLGGVTLTAHLTPGHTRGATTWTMDVTEKGQLYHVVFFSSASINAGTRLVGNPLYPRIAEDFVATFAKLRTIPCDIFFAPHGDQFSMVDKFARLDRGEEPNPLIDRNRLTTAIAQAERNFLRQLEREKAAASPSPVGEKKSP